MNTSYGVEAKSLILEIPDIQQLLHTYTNIRAIQDTTFIYETLAQAETAIDLLKETELFEEFHPLINLNKGREGEIFFDYGFYCQVYLYKNMVAAFSLHGDEQSLVEMAKLQLSEHLVYLTTLDSQDIFFIDFQLESLIRGIVSAYKCEARFLDLDKPMKKL